MSEKQYVRCPPSMAPEDRILFYGWTVTDTGCWEFNGPRTNARYGKLKINRRATMVHRLAYELWVGPIPEGLHILHSCDNPPCMNPEHLRPGTAKENMQDRERRGRRNITGERNSRAKLTWEQVGEIRDSSEFDRVLALKYGVSKATISLICRNETWVDPDYTPR